MIFRDQNGNIVEINKKEFVEDGEYYKKIACVYGVNLKYEKPDTKTKILNFIKQKK